MGERWLERPETLSNPSPRDVGGKAIGLLHLAAAEAPTPPWRLLSRDTVAGRLWASNAAALKTCFAALSVPPFRGVAVRSSAAGEDGRHSSRAGVYDTRMVESAEALPEALDAVAASAGHGADFHGMAIILQARVEAEVSGVLFSAHPASADYDRAYVEAVRGPGRLLVDGTASPWRWWLDANTGEVLESAQETEATPKLSSEIAGTLVRYMRRLEAILKWPVDIEWCVAGGRLWLVQARPLTSLSLSRELRPPVCATSWFFDQRFLDPVTPFTRTSLMPLVMRHALEEPLALKEGPAEDPPRCFYYGGLPYVEHAAWRRLLGDVPRCLLSHDVRQLFPEQCACPAPVDRTSILRAAWGITKAFLVQWRVSLLNLFAWRRFHDTLSARLDKTPEEWRSGCAALDALTTQFLRIHRWSLMWADYHYTLFRIIARRLPARPGNTLLRALQDGVRPVTEQANRALAAALQHPEDATALLHDYGHRSDSLDYAALTWADLAESGGLAAHYHNRVLVPEGKRRRVRWGRWFFYPVCRLLELREEQRFHWERILARQRARTLRAGATLVEEGILTQREDVWFLTFEEVTQGLENGENTLRSLVEQRKREYWINRAVRKPLFLGPEERRPVADTSDMTGTGASPGVAEGTVLVLRSPEDAPDPVPADTIAVLRALDPAWTTLLPQFAGCVIERGGLLSHAAILAREYGVPLVIGLEDATERIAPGERIRMDGTAGTVERLTVTNAS